MSVSPLAGKPAPASILVDPARLVAAYLEDQPDANIAAQRVAFGTSGHRGSSLKRAFNEPHILAITQAICDWRRQQGITGPIFVGRDTHALSAPAQQTALEVLTGNGVDARIAMNDSYVPTPVISHAILRHNREHASARADGIVITPSHNPPEDGGFKYNPPHGGPADSTVTKAIENAANAYLVEGNRGVRRVAKIVAKPHDFVTPYVDDLANAVDLSAIAGSAIRLAVDPLGGASVGYWGAIADRHRLNLTVTNTTVDPRFAFMRVDHDGRIRMDCSSPYAMAGLVELKDRYDLAFGNDTDADRHGIVVPSVGLMNPNHYLCVAIDYLFRHRKAWRPDAAVGKTLVSSSLIDRVANRAERLVIEVPVGFKWFVQGLHDGSLGFGGEESAGASFLRMDGGAWSTDKDGLLLALLAAEIRAVTDRDLGHLYDAITRDLGEPRYQRVDRPATPEQKAKLGKLSPDRVQAKEIAGSTIRDKLTTAPGNGEAIGGLKVVCDDAWFAARPSGTEDVYKIYAESFRDEAHLAKVIEEAEAVVSAALAS